MPFLQRQNLSIPSLENGSFNNSLPVAPVHLESKLTIPGVCTDYVNLFRGSGILQHFSANDLETEVELGHGNFAFVQKMRHRTLNCTMAVKVGFFYATIICHQIVRSVLNEREKNKSIKDLYIIMKSHFEHIVTFYGALFHESECWICMELMDSSLDKFYKIVYNERGCMIPESVLAKITVAVSYSLALSR